MIFNKGLSKAKAEHKWYLLSRRGGPEAICTSVSQSKEHESFQWQFWRVQIEHYAPPFSKTVRKIFQRLSRVNFFTWLIMEVCIFYTLKNYNGRLWWLEQIPLSNGQWRHYSHAEYINCALHKGSFMGMKTYVPSKSNIHQLHFFFFSFLRTLSEAKVNQLGTVRLLLILAWRDQTHLPNKRFTDYFSSL